MSIWYDVAQVTGLDYETERPETTIGVSLTMFDRARISIRRENDDRQQDTILLDAAGMRELAALLQARADDVERSDPWVTWHQPA